MEGAIDRLFPKRRGAGGRRVRNSSEPPLRVSLPTSVGCGGTNVLTQLFHRFRLFQRRDALKQGRNNFRMRGDRFFAKFLLRDPLRDSHQLGRLFRNIISHLSFSFLCDTIVDVWGGGGQHPDGLARQARDALEQSLS